MLRHTHRNSAMRLRTYTSCPVKRLRELRRMAAPNLNIQSQRLLICDWLRQEPRLPTLLHVLSSARNTFLSIESQVPVITFRCHFFVAHSAYPSFWALLMQKGPRKRHLAAEAHQRTSPVSFGSPHVLWMGYRWGLYFEYKLGTGHLRTALKSQFLI